MTEKIKLIAVVGPTATGKTAVAAELARQVDGEVVSCDSMQIYRGMEIASASPTLAEMREIPHHLIGIIDPGERFSVARYCELAHETIADITARGKTPILCGGTGLYYSSLVDGIRFPDEAVDDELRERLRKRAETEGGDALLGELRGIDPEAAARLSPADHKRIIRAIEVYRTTGITITEQERVSRLGEPRYDLAAFGLTFRDRELLYNRINMRVLAMLEAGLEREARHMLGMEGTTSAQAIGHKELAAWFAGECTREEAVTRLQQATRRYAKRQLTWFRRDGRIRWIEMDDITPIDAVSVIVGK